MKGSKSKIDRKFWDMVFGKLKKLGTAIEMFKGGDMSIDDPEYFGLMIELNIMKPMVDY